MMSKVSCFLADADSRIKVGLDGTEEAIKPLPEGCAFFGCQFTDFLGQRDDTLVIKLVIQEYFLKASTSTDAPYISE